MNQYIESIMKRALEKYHNTSRWTIQKSGIDEETKKVLLTLVEEMTALGETIKEGLHHASIR